MLRSFFIVLLSLVCTFHASAKTLIFESGSTSAASTSTANPSVSNQPGASRDKTYTTATAPASNPNAELFFMIEQLKREVSELRGIIEQQAYQLKNMEQSSKRRYQDIDARVLNLTRQAAGQTAASSVQTPTAAETAIVPVKKTEASSNVQDVPSEEQKQAYAEAYALVKEKKFTEAVDALHSFIEKYPEGELTGNAYYWLGEVYLVLPKLEQAKQAFMIVVKTFPGHRKVADSMFKLAVTFDRLHDPENSEKYLEMVQKNYPDSTASKLAKNYKIVR